jgi:hypothetical protein
MSLQVGLASLVLPALRALQVLVVALLALLASLEQPVLKV